MRSRQVNLEPRWRFSSAWIDGAIKEEAAIVLAAVGLTVADAAWLLLTKVARDKALPFEPLIPNATTIPSDEGGRVTKADVSPCRAVAPRR